MLLTAVEKLAFEELSTQMLFVQSSWIISVLKKGPGPEIKNILSEAPYICPITLEM